MKQILSFFLSFLFVCGNNAQTIPTPDILWGDLFKEVQLKRVFKDNKTFVDAVPKYSREQILKDYQQQKLSDTFNLLSFVNNHFTVPVASSVKVDEGLTIGAHIEQLWDVLQRKADVNKANSSLLPLPESYIVPGGRFREIYYWDSYFTMLGLLESGRQDLAQSMVENFAHLIDSFGHVPNGTRTYYLSRSQPPFFYIMVGLLDPADPAGAFAHFLPQLRREYAFWMRGAQGMGRGKARARVVGLPDGSILNRYWDDRDSPRDESYREDTELARESGRNPRQLFRDLRAAAESGWDFS